MASPGFLSKRVRKKSQTGLTTDRYEFLGLDQAEPDLGDPLVGPSSIGANPVPTSGIQYVLMAYENNIGKRYWSAAANVVGSGLIPGSFTVFDNNVQIGIANSFNRFNFIGANVSVDYVSSVLAEQTGVATVRITAKELQGQGNVYSIPYHSTSGFLDGANDFVYVNGKVGIGSTQPTVTLDIIGNQKVSGIITATGGFVGSLTGTATTATQLETTRYFSVSGDVSTGSSVAFNGTQNVGLAVTLALSGVTSATYGSTTSIPSISVNSKGIITGVTTSGITVGDGTLDLKTSGTGLTGSASFTADQNTNSTFTVTSNATSLNTGSTIVARDASGNFNAGIITATTFFGSLTGIASTATNVVGGIASVTSLNVGTGGTIITTTDIGLVGIRTTNPITPLQVETYGVKTGVGTFTASVGVSTTIDSFSVSSTDFKTAEYTVHIGFGSYIQAQKVLVMQNQTTAYSQEYGMMFNNSLIVSIGATISAGNCILKATPQTGVSGLTTYKFVRNTLL